MKLKFLVTSLAIATLLSSFASAQTTAFNFQGRLNDGSSPANGHYDLQFKLFDSIVGGAQVGATLDRPNLTLVNGVFSTTLDFGAAPFAVGNRFLEIAVRPFNSPNAFVILGARQQIMSVPFAVRSTIATNADNATNATNALNAASATTAAHAADAKALGGVAAVGYVKLNVTNDGNVVASNLGSAGILQVVGNTLQPETSNGLPKAMVAITAAGIIARCFNGVTGATTSNCGILSEASSLGGVYNVTFPFRVDNRFWLITNDNSATVIDELDAAVMPDAGGNPNKLRIDMRKNGDLTPLPFHLFVF